MASSRVTGRSQLREIEARLYAAPGELDKAVARRLRTVPPKVEKLVRAAVLERMPHRGGYAATLERSLRFRSSVQVRRGLTMTVWGEGKRQRRDLPERNTGLLRHPVFGRARMTRHGLKDNPWKVQRVRRGAVSDPFDEGARLAAAAVESALDDVKHTITR
jgi:hypothetical protein